MKAVHFGAGNIGRGFIGLLLSQAGYEVLFSDVNDSLVEQLKERKSYTVRLANEAQEAFHVSNVSAINGKQADDVAEAVAQADLVTTAVGVNILKHIAAGIAKGIELRLNRGAAPLHIIACENAIGGSTQLKGHVYSHLSADMREKADAIIAFPDAAVDRIVPLQHHEDPLQVTVEPFYEWVIDESQMLEGFHRIEGVHYVKQLEPYIERKLFTVNTGHCSAAYLGYLHGFDTIQAAMANPQIAALVRHVMEETGSLLIKKHGFDQAQHDSYIDKILNRFLNPYLIDEVARVGRSPIRKLSVNDRLVRPALQAYDLGMKPAYLAMAMAAAFSFKDKEDPEAIQIQADLAASGITQAITEYTTIPEDHPIHAMIKTQYEQFQQVEVS
ncbi:mannitol-1-phosphate 5-dehydrogenase [Paenibacillus marchantiophytorum]|uniref:Mannitol-1-phosphate 5-dehydrogenase n=1 Tax=Paenibacillus marchantiophytorum TaxID=1619310 RepID=A0ABQ2BPK4_9BACL|nr:mannitol-1-phosphate 5-dehydrogenase [Paenibacillus marchantiophytorum]GGI44563.1 mannitol-1-phosphate 5-dehydrogenase [Paenibacillus marchantiophytorum]